MTPARRRSSGSIKLSIGYSAVDWSPDYFFQALHEIRRLGFDGFEIGTEVVQFYSGREEEFLGLLRQVDLGLAGIFAGLTLGDPAFREADLEIVRSLVSFWNQVGGSGVLVVIAGESAAAEADSFAHAAETLLAVAEIAVPAGVRVCVKPNRGTMIASGDDLGHLLLATEGGDPPIHYCLDPAHLALSGTDPVAFVGLWPRRLGHVHLTDLASDPEPGARSPLTEPGAGTIPLRDLMSAVRTASYEGWIMGRVDTPYRSARASAEACASYFRDALGLSLRESGPSR